MISLSCRFPIRRLTNRSPKGNEINLRRPHNGAPSFASVNIYRFIFSDSFSFSLFAQLRLSIRRTMSGSIKISFGKHRLSTQVRPSFFVMKNTFFCLSVVFKKFIFETEFIARSSFRFTFFCSFPPSILFFVLFSDI